jgi:CHAT domain-containing protein/tetratricopeptide (TPR) repeat protein
MASLSPQWQHRLAVELAHTPHQAARKRMHGLFLWTGAAVAATLLLVAGLAFWWQYETTPERLLAEAYSHSRTFDLRIPGAAFAEVAPEAHLRGGATAREPARLLDARARIEHQLERTPEDPHWLQLEARADVLEEKYDPAIDILDRLLAGGPESPSVLVDDASAYFERGTATGSENDRATALDYLRRADEMAPGDSVVLFNEALVMEDRGQVMNAVETWNRYLNFERDPRWQEEGRRRLKALEEKLNQIKSHQSRMEQHLASPAAMRTLAADDAELAAIDEEFSTTLLPRLLDFAYPLPVDRSRGSPCTDNCLAARTLLHSLATSLERNHLDSWLTEFLPPDSSLTSDQFAQAAHALGRAMDADTQGDYSSARRWAVEAGEIFHHLGSAAGADRAELERAYALQRLSQMSSCYQAAHPLLNHSPQFAWIHAHDLIEDGICDSGPGAATNNSPSFSRARDLAQEHHYAILAMRARNMMGGAAVESGDTEDAWRIYETTIHGFYGGDFPPFRAYTIMAGLAEVEKSTPRVHLAFLLQREVMGLLELTPSRDLIPSQRFDLAIAAIRAGFIPEAQRELSKVQNELDDPSDKKPVQAFVADSEVAMANLYLAREDLASAAAALDTARGRMTGEDDSYYQRTYAAARGQLELARGHPEAAEPMLRDAVLEEERQARKVGRENIIFAQQNRDLYAVLAGIWLAEGRSGEDVLALWERYRLRILGRPVPVCADMSLDCLKPQLMSELGRLGNDRLLGQVALLDRTLVYRGTAQGVSWSTVPIGKEELTAAAARLERTVSSPATSQDSVDAAARRVGDLLLGGLRQTPAAGSQLLLETDPALGNLPWAAVETANGPIGLRFDIEEEPSLLLVHRLNTAALSTSPAGKEGSLIVGASFAMGTSPMLPEVLNEARAVAHLAQNSTLLLGAQATQAQVIALLETAATIHFAGHTIQQDGDTRLLLAPARTGAGGTGADTAFLNSEMLRKHPPRGARLVVFSACSTGKREAGWNHGMGDIVNTLASLGVPEVVATRWQIDSASAVPMMDVFYHGLADGLSVSQALTAARQSLIRDARYRHPYYWAAYYASGVGNTDLREVFHDSNR